MLVYPGWEVKIWRADNICPRPPSPTPVDVSMKAIRKCTIQIPFWTTYTLINVKWRVLSTASVCKLTPREYSTYRVVTTSRPKAPRHLVVHDNLKTFTKYSERSVQNLQGLSQLRVLRALGHCTIWCYQIKIVANEINDDR